MRSPATPLAVVAVTGALAAPASARPADLGTPSLSTRSTVSTSIITTPAVRAGTSGEATDPAPGALAAAGALTLLLCAAAVALIVRDRRSAHRHSRACHEGRGRGTRLCPCFDNEIRLAQERRRWGRRARVRGSATWHSSKGGADRA
jgi:hypothetical protein